MLSCRNIKSKNSKFNFDVHVENFQVDEFPIYDNQFNNKNGINHNPSQNQSQSQSYITKVGMNTYKAAKVINIDSFNNMQSCKIFF